VERIPLVLLAEWTYSERAVFPEPDERGPELDEVSTLAIRDGVRCGTPPRVVTVY
jgi:hypothetical protein